MNLVANPTQWLGLAVYALGTAACAIAARRRPSPWRGLAWAQAGAFAEVLVGLRLRVHDWADSLLQSEGWYATRQSLQWPLLIGVGLVAVAWSVVVILRWWRRDRLAGFAILATSAAFGLFALEVVSLHQLDALLYATSGPFMWVASGWAASAGATALAALLARFAADAPRRRAAEA